MNSQSYTRLLALLIVVSPTSHLLAGMIVLDAIGHGTGLPVSEVGAWGYVGMLIGTSLIVSRGHDIWARSVVLIGFLVWGSWLPLWVLPNLHATITPGMSLALVWLSSPILLVCARLRACGALRFIAGETVRHLDLLLALMLGGLALGWYVEPRTEAGLSLGLAFALWAMVTAIRARSDGLWFLASILGLLWMGHVRNSICVWILFGLVVLGTELRMIGLESGVTDSTTSASKHRGWPLEIGMAMTLPLLAWGRRWLAGSVDPTGVLLILLAGAFVWSVRIRTIRGAVGFLLMFRLLSASGFDGVEGGWRYGGYGLLLLLFGLDYALAWGLSRTLPIPWQRPGSG